MITSTLLIKEMPDGNVMVAMDPDQSGATKAELRVASIMDSALQAVGELILKGSGIMAEGDGIKEHVKKFVELHNPDSRP